MKRMIIVTLFVALIISVAGFAAWNSSSTETAQLKNMNMQNLDASRESAPPLIIKDFPNNGVAIHHMLNPDYQQEANYIFYAPPELMQDVRRYSIVIENVSSQHIVALSIIWTFYMPGQQPIPQTFVSIHANEMFSGRAVEGLITPKGKHGFCLMQNNSGIGERQGIRKIEADNAIRNRLARLNNLLNNSEKWSVEIGGSVFADGTFVGTNTNGFFEYLTAFWGGKRDLIRELVAKINSGEPYSNVFAHAQAFAVITDEQLKAPFQDMRDYAGDPFYSYNRQRRNLARHIVKYREQRGDDAAINLIIGYSKDYVPLVKSKT